jgi:hypothetical protein
MAIFGTRPLQSHALANRFKHLAMSNRQSGAAAVGAL